jgi:hypothetical protein
MCVHTHMYVKSTVKTAWNIDPLIGNNHETKNNTTVTAMQQLHKHAAVLEPLLGKSPCARVEVLLEVVFSLSSTRRLHHSTDQAAVQLSTVE